MKAPVQPLIAIMCIAVKVMSQEPDLPVDLGSDDDGHASKSNESTSEVTASVSPSAATTGSKIECDIRTAIEESDHEVGSQKK